MASISYQYAWMRTLYPPFTEYNKIIYYRFEVFVFTILSLEFSVSKFVFQTFRFVISFGKGASDKGAYGEKGTREKSHLINGINIKHMNLSYFLSEV